jgi:hypothetical protein
MLMLALYIIVLIVLCMSVRLSHVGKQFYRGYRIKLVSKCNWTINFLYRYFPHA